MAILPVFISSTFRDFQLERDELNRTVLPLLNELVAPFGCRVELIDLRWGIVSDSDDEESNHNRILEVCLTEIARAQPLFVGLLGDRYGWVAPRERIERAAVEAGMTNVEHGSSVTALEFEFGALRQQSSSALFFERDVVGDAPSHWRDEDLRRITALKARVRDVSPVHRYEVRVSGSDVDLTQFIAVVSDHLGTAVIDRARVVAGTRVDSTTAAIDIFFEDRLIGFAGRDSSVAAIVDKIHAGSSTCLLGESGVGKSAVWCAAVSRLSEAGLPVVAIPVAVSPEVATLYDVLARVCTALGSPPDGVISVEQLEQFTRDILGASGTCVLAIDALDQFTGDARLSFFANLPAGTRLLASTAHRDQAEYLAAAGVDTQQVTPLKPASARLAIEAISRSINRSLPPAAVDAIAAHDRSPLWLRLAVSELLTLNADDFQTMDPTADPLDEIARLLTLTVNALPRSAEELVMRSIARVQQRFGRQVVADILSFCTVSRSGLRPLDIEEVVGIDGLTLAEIRRGLAHLISPRRQGGRLGFSHATVGKSIARIIGDDRVDDLHSTLVAYFARVENDALSVDDWLWHAFRSPGQNHVVAELLDHAPFERLLPITAVIIDSVGAPYFHDGLRNLTPRGIHILSAASHTAKHDLPSDLRVSFSLEILNSAMELINRGDTTESAAEALSAAAGCLVDLPTTAGRDLSNLATEARGFADRLLAEQPDSIGFTEANALISQWFAHETTNADAELAALRRSADAWERLSERKPGIRADSWYQFALSQLGGAYERRQDWASAEDSYTRALSPARRVHAHQSPAAPGTTMNLINIFTGLGDVAEAQGDHTKALPHLRSAAELAENEYLMDPGAGNTRQLARAARSLGITLMNLGDRDAARDWLDRADSMCRRFAIHDPTDAQWRYGAMTAGVAAYADIVISDLDKARGRLRSYFPTAVDHDEALDLVGRLLLQNAKPKAPSVISEQCALIVVEMIEYVMTLSARTFRGDPTDYRAEAAQALASAQGDWTEQYGHHVELACDAMETIVENRLRSNREPAAAQLLLTAIELRRKRFEQSPTGSRLARGRELGSLLVLRALSMPDDHGAATSALEHWVRHLHDDPGDASVTPALARNLLTLGVNSLGQSPVVLEVAHRYATLLLESDPQDDRRRADLVGILDVIAVVSAQSGRFTTAAHTWIEAAQSAGDHMGSDQLQRIRQSVALNLRRVSREAALSRDMRQSCARWAGYLS